jgi:hypothetical protein
MGSSYPLTRSEIATRAWAERKMREARASKADAVRMALADKIVMAVVDRIAADIIRPGPTPEERECYVMAQELRDHTTHLKELVVAILKVEKDERG